MFSGPLKLQPSGDSGELFCSKQTLSLQQDGVVAALLEAHASAVSFQWKSHWIVSIVGEVTSICNKLCNTIMVLVKWHKKRSAIAVYQAKGVLVFEDDLRRSTDQKRQARSRGLCGGWMCSGMLTHALFSDLWVACIGESESVLKIA